MTRKHGYELLIWEDMQGQYRWKIFATNGKIIAESGEGYLSRSNAIRAARRLRVIAAGAVLVK